MDYYNIIIDYFIILIYIVFIQIHVDIPYIDKSDAIIDSEGHKQNLKSE